MTADLHDAVRRIADAQAGIVIESDMPDHLPRVALPQGAVEAVLSSLVDNSRQAGATRMRITGEDNRDVVILTVGDDGPGIPPGDRARVFDPFFTSRRTEGGTGLGLPIARSLLEAQGGTIALAPNAGGGATFRIALPVSRCG